jgi:hypothetical protein
MQLHVQVRLDMVQTKLNSLRSFVFLCAMLAGSSREAREPSQSKHDNVANRLERTKVSAQSAGAADGWEAGRFPSRTNLLAYCCMVD